MKILVATGLYPPEIGGPATHIEILERELPQCDVEVVSVPFGEVRRYPKILRHFMYFVQIVRNLKGVSVVYALDPVSVGLPAWCASVLFRRRFVLRVAGDYAWEQGTSRYGTSSLLDVFVRTWKKEPFVVRMLVRIERFVARRADRVVVPSKYLEGIVRLWGVGQERITVVYNAFIPQRVEHSRETVRQMFGFEGFVVMSAGRLVPWKGFRTLIRVIADMSEEGVLVTGVIIGDGPEKEALVAYAKECGISERIRFVERQPKEALAVAISGADVFVLNTGYEGFSHQLLEVMALGVPIVTTDIGGNRELLSHGETALLVPYDDKTALKEAVVHVMRNEADRLSLSKKAQEHAFSFSVQNMVSGVCDALHRAQ